VGESNHVTSLSQIDYLLIILMILLSCHCPFNLTVSCRWENLAGDQPE